MSNEMNGQGDSVLRGMVLSDTTHSIMALVDALDGENLRALEVLLISAAENPATAAYWAGVAGQRNRSENDACICGCDASDILGNKEVGSIEPMEPEAQVQYSSDHLFILEAITKYNLRVEGDAIVCAGCGKSYTSIEDRMLRPPGAAGCPGCTTKTKWG